MKDTGKVPLYTRIGMIVTFLSYAPMFGVAAEQGVPILRMAKQWKDPSAKECGGTIWRYHETWRTDVARKDSGDLVNVDPDVCRQKAAGGNDKIGPFELAVAKRVAGSEFAPAGWEQPDFDDSEWIRNPGPIAGWYRSLAAMNLRGKFEVKEPASVSEMNLMISFQGGAVAYLNGKEIGREGLPAGKITNETLANDYPLEATSTTVGRTDGLITQCSFANDGISDVYTKEGASTVKGLPVEQYQKRFRTLNVKIPGASLRKGINVLAIEIHRAAAPAIMFTAPDVANLVGYGGNWNRGMVNFGIGWNRCWVDDIQLSALASGNNITPNITRPDGLQVWNASTLSKNLPTYFGDPNESVRPIRFAGLRNGTFSGQIIVSSSKAIKGFKASVSILKTMDGKFLPESVVSVGYGKWDEYCGEGTSGSKSGAQYDTLETVAPDDIPANIPAITGLAGERQIGPFHVAFLPLWLTVRVPRNAEPGIYAGELVASADGEKTVRVPVQFRVAGHWALPDPVEFKTMVGMVESPDSVAMQYGVKMWSAEHWKMLDQVFALMGEVGVGDLYIPLLAKTNLANDDSMVRWIKQADGSYKHDFSIVERYLDLALKHLGRKCLVVLWINDYPFFRSGAQNWAGKSVNLDDVSAAREANTLPLPYTELNPETGLMTEKQAPQWGTPEAKTFWKPVFDGITAALAKRGMEKNMLFGCFTDGNIYPKCVAVCSELAPQAKWYARTHHMGNYYEAKKYNGYFNWGCWVPAADDVMVVNWTPDTGTSEYYRWRMPMWKTSIPTVTGAWSMNQNSELPIFRMMAESILLGNAGEGPIKTGDMVHGIGCQGADFWPVLVTDTDKRGKSLATQIRKSRLSMYTDQGGVMDQSSATFAFLGRGKNGPVATYHLRLLQEAQQDMEARIFVQDALLDHTDKLGPDLARRCKDICDDRTRQLHHYSNCMMSTYHRIFPRDIFDDGWYRRNTGELYALTDEVAKALGK